MTKHFISTLIFLFNFSLFAFNMSPDSFQKRIDLGASQEYIFRNNTGRPVRYVFDILPGNINKSMHEWVQFEPKYLNIEDGKSKKLKISVKSPQEIPIGEYNFFLNVKTIPIPNKIEVSKEGNISGAPRIGFSINIEMIGWIGDLPAQLKLEKFIISEETNTLKLKGTVRNQTEKRSVRYKIEVIGKNQTRETFYGGTLNALSDEDIIINLNKFKNKNDLWKIEVREILSEKLLQTITI
ncbi:MAG: hypothetical protein ACRC3I_03295 [Cetobacterium sp.]